MLVRRLLALDRSAPRLIVAAIVSGTLAGLAAIGLAWLVSRMIDAVFLGGAGLPQISAPLAAAAALAAMRAALNWAGDSAGSAAAWRIQHAARSKIIEHLFSLGPAALVRHKVGELTVTTGEGVEALDAFVGQFLPQRTLALLVPLSIVAVVLAIDPISAILLALTGPLIPLFLWLVGGASAQQARRQWRTLGRLSAQFLDALQGLATLKAFGRGQARAERIRAASESFRGATMRLLRVAFLSSLTLEWLATLSTALIAVQVGVRLLYADLTFDAALFVLLLAPEFYLPLRSLGARFHAGASGREAATEIFRLLDEPIPVLQPSLRPTAAGAIRPVLAFEGVGFVYPSQREPALRELTLQLPRGSRLAVVGPSGAGKTTLAHLALGWLRPTQGLLTLNGQPCEAVDAAFWRRSISWLPQSPALLSGTIEENLRLAKPDSSLEAIRTAARRAGAEAFIAALPEGYDTQVGEAGLRLSAGEVKRIGLARAFLRDAPLWILDEPTALLDTDLEAFVRDSLQALPADRTLLLISHRLAGLPPCDQIVVLAQGTAVESGTPAELAQSGTIYPELLAAYDLG